jgi:hypothetical protein
MSKVVINSMDRKTNNVDQWLYTVDNPDESVFIVNIFGDDINNLEVNLYTVPPDKRHGNWHDEMVQIDHVGPTGAETNLTGGNL